ncbi:hypothetical protein [Streptomyces sp. NPDC050121]|uniref:hypothetical protein n=1 Tax=Streptomyces sp. NPDC050121 TaxID=3365601 RepID=UPI0037B5C782
MDRHKPHLPPPLTSPARTPPATTNLTKYYQPPGGSAIEVEACVEVGERIPVVHEVLDAAHADTEEGLAGVDEFAADRVP